MTGWPWLCRGWALHCHAGQFPPGRVVCICTFNGLPMRTALVRPRRAGTDRGAIAKWPAHAHPERQRLYSSAGRVVIVEPGTTSPRVYDDLLDALESPP